MTSGEDGPIPVVVDAEAYTRPGTPADDVDSLYDARETRDGAGAARRALGTAGDLYGEGLDLARRCASQAMRRLGDLGYGLRPDEVELQVGITFEAGMAAVVKAGAEAQIQVTFRWQPGREEQATTVVSPS
ncbi:CU044_2847 family protein [Streptomyces sp. NPDC005134]|uniref:CU044_2847 family protein n=1 Tax=Streptomyces sp. NPDC005098 TaxID=3154560 RepID=UPI0033A62DAD